MPLKKFVSLLKDELTSNKVSHKVPANKLPRSLVSLDRLDELLSSK